MPGKFKKRVQEAISGLDEVLREIEGDSQERSGIEEESIWGRLETEASFQFAPVIFFLVDERRIIRQANDAATSFIGLPRDHIVGKRVGDILDCINATSGQCGCSVAEDCASCPINLALSETLERVRRTDDLNTTITCQSDEKSQERHFFLTTVPFAVGSQRYALLSMLDVTRWKEIHQEFERRQRLESIGSLAGSIAHDMNNLLTVILGNLSLAKSFAPECSDAIAALDRATGAALRAADLSTQLLTFTSGGEPNKASFRIEEILRNLGDGQLPADYNPIDLDLPELKLPLIYGDRVQLHQALANVLQNAVEASSPDESIKVIVKEELVEDERASNLHPGHYVHITVEDKGPGIADAHLPFVADPYYTTKEGHHGLGLTTTHSILKQHGGDLVVETTATGARVHLWIPLTEADDTCSGAQHRPADSGQRLDLTASANILLMDDEEWLRECTAEMLENFGWSVSCARDGSEAIDLYEEAHRNGRPYDCVILDLTVPEGLGGLETMKALMTIDPHVIGVVSSGYHHDPIMANYWEYGFSAVLPKPYSLHQLDETIRSVLSKRQKEAP